MGSGRGKSKRAQSSASHAGAAIIGEGTTAFATNYEYVVEIPGNATIEDIEGVVEMLRGIGGAELNVEKRRITGDFDLESENALEAGYDLRVFEEEINTELSSRGWSQVGRPQPSESADGPVGD